MHQIIQNIKTGDTSVVDVPAPRTRPGTITIRSALSLISAGTERMLVEFGSAGWIGKARQQPDKVREVVDKVRNDGLGATAEAVLSKLDQPLPLGYANAGVVVETGSGVNEYAPGDRVVSNGAHAEIVNVPVNLCARIPDEVSFDTAVYTVPAAIALQGIRLARPTLGEIFVVTGLGLIGQLAVQLLVANGCRVLGIDPDPGRRRLAEGFGAATCDPATEEAVAAGVRMSRGRGVDGVIITAATRSNGPVSEGARMCRKRGRIVLVGVAGLNLSRADFYEKELSFQVSCSYGPGRYDPEYEHKGHDYPPGFVRWTEQRNFEAVLDLMARGTVRSQQLTSHRYPVTNATDAYGLLQGEEPYMGIVLEYPPDETAEASARRTAALKKTATPAESGSTPGTPVVAFVGAGNYAGRVLIPAFKKGGAALHSISATSGVGPAHYGRKYRFERAGTDIEGAISDEAVNIVVVATRHDSHADLTCRAIENGKHVFVEKPLALSLEQVNAIQSAYQRQQDRGRGVLVAVGFNRRFSPLTRKLKQVLDSLAEPKAIVITINAGHIDHDHWTQDRSVGGGRIVGEACHFVDLARHLCGAPISGVTRCSMIHDGGTKDDVSTLGLEFEDGSIASIHYLANGSKSFPKERIEVFCAGRVLVLDNFHSLKGFGTRGFRRRRLWRQDKGQSRCVEEFLRSVREGAVDAPIPFNEILEVSRASIELAAEKRGTRGADE